MAVVAGVAAWKFIPRPWKPAVTIETAHYIIASTATPDQTEEIGRVVEILYNAYSNRFSTLTNFQRAHPKLKLILYKDRDEFRHANPNLGWAEAFYREPYCRAYYSEDGLNPYHWMLHEAVHQLNSEVAHLHLAKWLDEGLASYFSTSRIYADRLDVGRIDPNTYPVWWMQETIATAADFKTNITNGSIIPLRAIISNSGGPSLDKEFNLYYLHWWTLTHFLFETSRYSRSMAALMQQGGGIEAFERTVGKINAIEPLWYRHVRRIKSALAGTDAKFLKTGQLPPELKKPQ